MAELKPKTLDAAGRRVKTPGEPPLAKYADKEPTELQRRFAQWIHEKTGVEPDLATVALAVNLRMAFQRSDENQVFVKQSRERAAAQREAKAARSTKAESKPAEPKRRRPKPVVEAESNPEPEAPVVGGGDAPAPKPEPMFDDKGADESVAKTQKPSVAKKPAAKKPASNAGPKDLSDMLPGAKPAPRPRRSSKDANRDLVD